MVTHSFEISVTHRDFDDYWDSHTKFTSPQPYSGHDGRESREIKTDGSSYIADRRSWRDFVYGLA